VYKLKRSQNRSRTSAAGAPQARSQMFRTPEYFEKRRYRLAEMPPTNRKIPITKKIANDTKRVRRLEEWVDILRFRVKD
jgi:hypothetical protein